MTCTKFFNVDLEFNAMDNAMFYIWYYQNVKKIYIDEMIWEDNLEYGLWFFTDFPPERHRSMHGIDANNLMKIYDTVPRNDEMFSLERRQIKLDQENLGQ